MTFYFMEHKYHKGLIRPKAHVDASVSGSIF
jgi:hypothetical protein